MRFICKRHEKFHKSQISKDKKNISYIFINSNFVLKSNVHLLLDLDSYRAYPEHSYIDDHNIHSRNTNCEGIVSTFEASRTPLIAV